MKKRLTAILLSLCLIITAFVNDGTARLTAAGYSSVIAGGSFNSETDFNLWSVYNRQDQVTAFDSANGHTASGSLKLTMPTSHYGDSKRFYLRSGTVDGADTDFDPKANYSAEMYIKTSEDFCGTVYLRIRQGSSYIQSGTSPDLMLLGTKNSGADGHTDWIRLKTESFSLKSLPVTVLLYVNGTGTVWIDDFDIKEDNELLTNGGFESGLDGWNNWGSLDTESKSAAISNDVTCLSAGALKLSNTESGSMLYMVSSGIKPDPDKQYTLSLDVKAEGTENGGVFGRIYEYYNDPSGNSCVKWLSCYGSENAFATGGTTDWKHYDIRLSGFEKTATNFVVMLYLAGKGTAYFDNVSVTERVAPAVPLGTVTADIPSGTVTEPNTHLTLYSSEGSDIYYTVDGSNPTASETAMLHNENYGILITETVEIKACAVTGNSVGAVYTFDYTCDTGLVKDDVLWGGAYQSGAAVLDGNVRMSGENSLKITGGSGTKYTTTEQIAVDGTFDYLLEFWVKTEGIPSGSNAFVNVFMPGSGSVEYEFDGSYGAYVKTKNIISDVRDGRGWTRYELLIDDLEGYWNKLIISAGIRNCTGTLWIDGVSLTALPYEYHPMSVQSDGKVFGNNYFLNNIPDGYIINQGIIFSDNANNAQSTEITYEVYNDSDMSRVIDRGAFDISVAKGSQTNYSLILNSCNSFGTYTVNFFAKDIFGHKYDVGFIKLAVIRDASDINSNSILGVNCFGTLDYGIYADSGIGLVRTDFHWKNAEAVEGQFTVNESYDKYVDSSIANGMEVMLILGDGDGPSWFKPGDSNRFPKTDTEIAQFVSYAKKAVEYFKGRVKYYEIYNEADWSTPIRVDGATYGRLLNAVYSAIKEVDPNAYVVAGATSLFHGDWAAEVFKTAPNSMDYWSCHPYANPASPESRNWIEGVEALQESARKYTGRTVPFLFTEVGWSDNKSSGGVNQSEQLKWYVRLMAFAESVDYVEKVLIYNDCCGGTRNRYVQELRWGMFESAYSVNGWAHPFVAGLTNYICMTDGYSFNSRSEPLEGIHLFKYTSTADGKVLYMLWSEDQDFGAKVTVSGAGAVFYDIFGNRLDIPYEGNVLNVDIGGNPIYFTLNAGETVKGIEASEKITEKPSVSEDGVIVEEFDTLHSGISDKGLALDTANAYSGEASLKIDLSEARYANYGCPGARLILRPDMSRLDVNRKYRLKLAVRADNTDIVFNARFRTYGTVNGSTVSAKWNTAGFDDFLLAEGLTLSVMWTELTCFETVMPFGNDFYIELFLWTAEGTVGNIYLDKAELIPVDNGLNDGTVSVTGYNTVSGKTIYTAYANDGYTVDDIYATVYNGSTEPVYLSVKEISRSQDNKTVEFEVAASDGLSIITNGCTEGVHTTLNPFDARYITVLFGSDVPLLKNSGDKYTVSDFDENSPDNYGNCTTEYHGSCGRSYSSSNGYDEFVLYIEPNAVHKFDAANNYRLSAFFKSTSDWQGAVQVSAYALMGSVKTTLRSNLYEGEFDLLGKYNSAFVTPGGTWSEYALADDYMLPIVGERIKLVFRIKRTSQSGTLYIDDIALSPNGISFGAVKSVDYNICHGYVKSSYDYGSNRLILTPLAFDGSEYDSMNVYFRAVGGVSYGGTEYSNTHCEINKVLTELKSVKELSFAVALDNVSDASNAFCFQTHAYLGRFCDAGFKPAVAGVPGDADNNGTANIKDLVRTKKYLADNSTEIRIINIDYNGTLFAELEDLVTLKKQLLGILA